MANRLSRITALLGDDAMDKLRGATVMVVGCGAVGSFAVEALARSGVGGIVVVDFDVVEESNINRQLFALGSTIGMPKVDVAASRIHDINPDAKVIAINAFVDDNIKIDITPDFVIDAIDTVDSKIALYKWCVAHNVPFVASMGAAMKTDISKIQVAKISKTTVCPLAARVRKMVRDAGLPDFPVVYSTEAPHKNASAPGRVFGSIVTVTGSFGLRLADVAIKHICGLCGK
ncbi:MAG: tRNA threonylcarbamoyladenosine dehydratase [Alphaproteobacteria bacterium]|nr:tRNA threonylcarbamoyladenosine dehydratase [Alphaproteobacteria bacterium]